jgi:NAD(P)H-hydrate repair Nnr-like enzyme with NAD(P)H-hydrate dehydratase domain
MDYWAKQPIDKPLYPDIIWARPETKHGAGKLLIIGGSAHGFAAAQEAYASADIGGAGHIRLILPDALKRTVGILGPYDYAPSTPRSGSFARDALNEFLIGAAWADSVLLAGDLGRNSETAILLEKFVQKYSGPLTITKDAVDYFYNQPELVSNRSETLLVLSLGQLQKFATALKFETPFMLSMGMLLLVQALHDFTIRYKVIIITKELNNIIVAKGGEVSSTRLQQDKEVWRVSTAAKASVFWMQNSSRPFEAITTALAA